MIKSLLALSPLTGSPPAAYIGRFAPSPTGPLHQGSLVSALASYLHAYSYGGQWLVRMEDLDPPREIPGAATAILRSLEDHGLEWDGEVLYQSRRLPAYEEVVQVLRAAELVYPCDCTRQDLQAMNGIYDGRCRTRRVDSGVPHALRLKLYDLPQRTTSDLVEFVDLIQGEQTQNLRSIAGDQIVKRKDGLFAYQLAVVVDDIAQRVTHIIRGRDLLDVSARQIFLFQLLNASVPVFGHVPLVMNGQGQKLSKQNLAEPLSSERAGNNLWHALTFLGQNPPAELHNAEAEEVLNWARTNWQLSSIKAGPTGT